MLLCTIARTTTEQLKLIVNEIVSNLRSPHPFIWPSSRRNHVLFLFMLRYIMNNIYKIVAIYRVILFHETTYFIQVIPFCKLSTLSSLCRSNFSICTNESSTNLNLMPMILYTWSKCFSLAFSFLISRFAPKGKLYCFWTLTIFLFISDAIF